ncbi:uncharacterized protein [Temnothorax nylanderi]|uniref:uncharacterized protein n=1 Tax=Temnothorax nylanderi TaxID=102681 RepID=UPI003A845649
MQKLHEMGKRKHRHRSSDDENRERKLQKRVEWLEEQILQQRENERCNERHVSRRQSSSSRSRSRSHRRDYHDYDRYDSKGRYRRQYRGSYSSEQEDRDRNEYYHDDKYSKHSAYSNYRREHASTDRRKNSRSKSLDNVRGSRTSSSSSPEPVGGNKSNDNVAQPDIQTATEITRDSEDAPAVVTGSNDKLASDTRPPAEAIPSEVQEDELEADVLEVFGERIRPERVLAPAVHSHLAAIWCEIIEKGLPAEDRKTSLKKFPPPENCVLMDPPKLNLEVKAALDSTIQKRDERIVEKQEKIAASLAGVGKTIELLLKSNLVDKKKFLEPLTGVAKLLADLQHDETSIRRSLILKNIKAPFKDTLKDLSSDEWLFGKELSEKIKAAKVLQQSTKDLKPSFKQSSDKGKYPKNSKGPPHQGYYKSNIHSRRGGYRQNYSRSNYSRDNKSTSRGRSHYQKQEQTNAKKSS